MKLAPAAVAIHAEIMMRARVLMTASALAAINLAACSSTPPAPPIIATVPPPTPVPVAPVAVPPAPGVVGASIGQSLDEKDRGVAITAQQDAVSSGQRKSWRGAHGAYGFVTPGTESGACRDYTHRIFINGRPQEAKGQACKQDGQWRVTS